MDSFEAMLKYAIGLRRQNILLTKFEDDEFVSICGEAYAETAAMFDPTRGIKFQTLFWPRVYHRAVDYWRVMVEPRTKWSQERKNLVLRHSAGRYEAKMPKRVAMKELPLWCLTKSQKMLINLILEGLSHEEIATLLGMNVHTVTTVKNQAIKRMQNHVASYS